MKIATQSDGAMDRAWMTGSSIFEKPSSTWKPLTGTQRSRTGSGVKLFGVQRWRFLMFENRCWPSGKRRSARILEPCCKIVGENGLRSDMIHFGRVEAVEHATYRRCYGVYDGPR